MRFNDLERILIESGYVLVRSSKHKIYSNGKNTVAIPHQKEVNKMMVRRILKEIKNVA
jgi:predicted RNA binding protein YcfA (HicA-like mRNA interferase family)